MGDGSREVVFWIAQHMGVVGVRAASVPVLPQLQVGHGESLCAKPRHKVFESRDVLVNDLLGAQPPLVHSVLLEGPHKVCEHPIDPDPSQKVVFGDVFGERLRDAAQEAGEIKR